MSKIDSFTRSVVGRTESGSAALRARTLATPLTTRTRSNLANVAKHLTEGRSLALEQKFCLGLIKAGA